MWKDAIVSGRDGMIFERDKARREGRGKRRVGNSGSPKDFEEAFKYLLPSSAAKLLFTEGITTLYFHHAPGSINNIPH